MSSGVRLRLSGSSAGSPFGSPSASGLTRAARWPWVRKALSSEVAACTAWSSSRSGSAETTALPAPAAPTAGSGGAEAAAGCAFVTTRSEIARSCRDRLVEVVLALEELVDPAQERAGLGALDDPVVVRRGHRRDLRDAERLQLLGRSVRPLDRVGDRADGDDRALARHEARHRGDRADAAWVGQRDVRALEVVGGELVLPRLRDQVLVIGVEAGEVERVGAADARHHERARAVLALDVHGDAEVHPGTDRDPRLVVVLGVGAGHHVVLGRRAHDRPCDQVRERDLEALLLELGVDRLSLGVERVDGKRPERGRRRHLAALVHQVRERPGGAAERLLLALGGCRRGRGAVAAVRRREDVGLHDLAAGARALDRADVDPAVGSHARGDWGDLATRAAAAADVGSDPCREASVCPAAAGV